METFSELRQFLQKGFSLDELKTLTSDLGIDYENLPADKGKEPFVRELLLLLHRNGKLDELISLGKTTRPNLMWPDNIRKLTFSQTQKDSEETAQSTEHGIDWPLIIKQISKGRFTPLISDPLVRAHLFASDNIVEAWAEEVNYPISDRKQLAHIAHFVSIIHGNYAAKTDYLEFLKGRLINKAESNNHVTVPNRRLTENWSVSQMADETGYIRTASSIDSPIAILAKLPLPLYLTTSYHTVLETALSSENKKPKSAIYPWTEDLPSQLLTMEHFEPSVQEPLVYHLMGIDSNPESMVLTEEDYFQFFERAAYDVNHATSLPATIRNALSRTSLMLLGYDLQSWAFRVVFRGPIKALLKKGRPLSLAIQIVPGPDDGIVNLEEFQRYVREYFRDNKFSIYWGDAYGFARELWQHWEAREAR